jgi:hypothetical protein
MSDFSPFDAPVKEPHSGKTDPSGIKMEKITDAELDGKKGGSFDAPKDAPVFEIPQFDEIPEGKFNGGFQADPFAPGSSDDNGKTSNSNGGGNGGGGGGESTKVDSAFAKEFSDYTAKWLVDIFFRLVLAAFRKFAQIDKSEIVKAIEQGFIDERFLKFIDEANDNVEKSINVTEDEKKFVIEPLKYFLEVKKVQLKPEWMFLVGLLMVTGGLFIKAMDIKKDNKALIDKIIKESADIKSQKRGDTSKADDDFYKKRKDDYGDVETFTDKPKTDFSFSPPPAEPNIEVVDAEIIPNDED